ncbi:MAG: hypothetical protein ACYSWZ_19670 [Planctomycetota bacterium]
MKREKGEVTLMKFIKNVKSKIISPHYQRMRLFTHTFVRLFTHTFDGDIISETIRFRREQLPYRQV